MKDLKNHLSQEFQDPDPKSAEVHVYSCDPDFTKAPPSEALAINLSATEMASVDYLTDSDINWN